jgi:hypothetical protein
VLRGPITFGRFLGKGFFTVKKADAEAVRQLLLLSPFRSVAGMCIFQRWILDFDPEADRGIRHGSARAVAGLTIPTWITLRNLQDEFRGVAHQIVAGLSEVLGAAPDNNEAKDPRFCIGLKSGEGWEHEVTVTNKHTQTKSVILIDYTHLPICCWYCGDTSYCLWDCPYRPVLRRPRDHGTGHVPRNPNLGPRPPHVNQAANKIPNKPPEWEEVGPRHRRPNLQTPRSPRAPTPTTEEVSHTNVFVALDNLPEIKDKAIPDPDVLAAPLEEQFDQFTHYPFLSPPPELHPEMSLHVTGTPAPGSTPLLVAPSSTETLSVIPKTVVGGGGGGGGPQHQIRRLLRRPRLSQLRHSRRLYTTVEPLLLPPRRNCVTIPWRPPA